MNLNTKIFLIPDWMIFLAFLKRDGKVNLTNLNKMSHINYASLHRIKKELISLEWITEKDKEETFIYAVLTDKGKSIADKVESIFNELELDIDQIYIYRRVKHSLRFGGPSQDMKPKVKKNIEVIEEPIKIENKEEVIEESRIERNIETYYEDIGKKLLNDLKEGETNDNNKEGI